MKEPTDPTAVRDFVMACAEAYALAFDKHPLGQINYEKQEALFRAEEAEAKASLQQAVKWAMARARAAMPCSTLYGVACDSTTPGKSIGGLCPAHEAEADAAAKWKAMQ